MAKTVEEAQAAVDAAQAALDAARKSGKVSGTVAASRALSAAQKELEAAQRGISTAGKSRADVIGEITRQNIAAERQQKAQELGPRFDPTMRPEAPQDEPGYIQYYSWIGDRWKLYKVSESAPADQVATAEARSKGGQTAATWNSIVGANTIIGPGGSVITQTGGGAGGGAGGTTGGGGGIRTTGGAGGGTSKLGADGGLTAESFITEQAAKAAADAKRAAGQSAFDFLREQFSRYGLEGLLSDVEKYIKDGLSPAEFTLRLRTESKAYQNRFAANQARIAKGLRALSEAEYIGLEDQYQNVMRNYGLPASYYERGDMGRQPGFEKFIGGDVSAAELEDRIQTAQNRVINAAPEVSKTLREFYPDISNGDILAYALDPEQALTNIRRKVTAAEIGAGAAMSGLATGVARAEELGRYGVTAQQAREGFQAVAQTLPRGSQLAEIYKQQPYTQTTAEQEVFGLAGATEAQRQRRKLTELEQASFSGQAGVTGGALARDRAGQF